MYHLNIYFLKTICHTVSTYFETFVNNSSQLNGPWDKIYFTLQLMTDSDHICDFNIIQYPLHF